MALTLSNSAASAACDAIVALIDADASPAYVIVLAGASPLVTLTLDDPSFGSASNGVASGEGLPILGTATDSGTATRFELYDGNDTLILEGTVGGTAQATTGDMQLSSSAILVDDVVALTSLTLTAPKFI